MAWMGVALLPFIDERRLLAQTRALEATLTAEEQYRNSMHAPRLFVSRDHPAFSALAAVAAAAPADREAAMAQRSPLDPALSAGICGSMAGIPGTPQPGTEYPLPGPDCEPLRANAALGVFYFVPAFTPHVCLHGCTRTHILLQ